MMIFDPRAIAYLSSSFICIAILSVVFGGQEKSKMRDAFILQALFAFIWQIGTYFVLTAPTVEVATLISRISYVGCIFLSVASYQLVVQFLSLTAQIKFVHVGYAVGSLLFVPLLFTDLLLQEAYHYEWGYWFNAGVLHPLYLVFFSIYGLAAFFNVWFFGRKVTNRRERKKATIIFWAYLLCYFSVIDFLPDYGYDVSPLGFLFVSMFLFALWFVVTLHDLFFKWEK